jgi:GT2 family glycosyltransferase
VAICTAGRPSLAVTLQALSRCQLDHVADVLVVNNAGERLGLETSFAAVLPLRILDGHDVLSVSRNMAIAAARTDLVLFTDDDCIPDVDWVDRAVAHMAASPTTAAGFGRVLPSERAGCLIRESEIPDLGIVAWGEIPGAGEWCPAISAPSWTTGPATRLTVPWACVGSSNNLFLRRSAMLPRRRIFQPDLGAGTPACSGEDTELGYSLLRAGRRVDHVGDARVVHDRWVPATAAPDLTRCYFRGNVAAIGMHAMRGDARADLVLRRYTQHVRSLSVVAAVGDLFDWAYGPDAWHPSLHGLDPC